MTEDTEETVSLTLDMREQFIISKALHTAMETLKQEKHPAYSDIACMMVLLDKKFPIYSIVATANEACGEQLNKLQQTLEDSEL
jgi:hypothetical protein